MSLLKNITVKETVVEVEYPDIEGFKVQVAYLNRDALTKIRDKSMETKFNSKSRVREDTVNSEKFLEIYAEKAIRGWSGLYVKDLPKMLPVDLTNINPESEVEYSKDDALWLLKNSTMFDQFITDQMQNFEQFSIEKTETEIKN